MDWFPFYLSAKLALVTTLLLLFVGAPVAYWLSFARFRGKSLVEALVNLPLVLPPTVLGFYLLVVMGPKGWAGRIWELLTGGTLIFSFSGILVASMVYNLPFSIQPLKAAFGKIDYRLIESAYVLGLSRTGAFFRVILPNSLGGLASSAILVFVHTLGEFGVILMVGGSVPGKTKVVSIAIYEAVEALRYHDAAVMSLLLIPVCYGVLLAVNFFGREKKRHA